MAEVRYYNLNEVCFVRKGTQEWFASGELMEDGKIYQTQFYNFDAFISLIPHINFPRIYGPTREILRSHGEKVFSRGSVKKVS